MEEKNKKIHEPVLLNEVLNNLNIFENMNYLDGTIGYAGHFTKILEKTKYKGNFYGFDQDLTAYNYCLNLFKDHTNVYLFHSNFKDINKCIDENIKFDAILLDLGVSSLQFDEPNRGFSYHCDARLDMRMNQEQFLDAYQVINNYSMQQLIEIFQKYGEAKNAYKVAKAICDQRKAKPIATTFELRDLIYKAEFSKNLNRKNPCKIYFQALRIYVNDEINVLKNSIHLLANKLNKNGTLGIITFHSLEDKIVKDIFLELTTEKEIYKHLPINEKIDFELVNKKPIIPNDSEVELNIRAHSAKLRILKKI